MEGEAPPAVGLEAEASPDSVEASPPETPAPAAVAEPTPPASPPFADVPLAPAVAVTSVEVESGQHLCAYCDVPTLTNLGEALLTASVEAAILSTTGNVFEKAEPRIQPLFNELCSYLKAQTNAGTLPVRRWR